MQQTNEVYFHPQEWEPVNPARQRWCPAISDREQQASWKLPLARAEAALQTACLVVRNRSHKARSSVLWLLWERLSSLIGKEWGELLTLPSLRLTPAHFLWNPVGMVCSTDAGNCACSGLSPHWILSFAYISFSDVTGAWHFRFKLWLCSKRGPCYQVQISAQPHESHKGR